MAMACGWLKVIPHDVLESFKAGKEWTAHFPVLGVINSNRLLSEHITNNAQAFVNISCDLIHILRCCNSYLSED